jgi:hypothetical protein
MGSCKQVDDPNSGWGFCPNVGVSYLYAIMFGILFITHFVQMIVYRKLYSLVIVFSAFLQTLVFVFRILSINKPDSELYYTLWFVIILVAPIFTNAYVYMVFGRMVHNFLLERRLGGLQARRYSLLFVTLDIIAFIIQVGGAIAASGDDISQNRLNIGLHIYMGGVSDS